jgi:hypothetical protein
MSHFLRRRGFVAGGTIGFKYKSVIEVSFMYHGDVKKGCTNECLMTWSSFLFGSGSIGFWTTGGENSSWTGISSTPMQIFCLSRSTGYVAGT